MKKEMLQQLKPDNIPTQNQVDLLAQFLIENFEEEIGKGESPSGEGAIEMAVRLLTKLKEQKPAEEGKSFQEMVVWIAEYAYRKANPKGKKDTPSIVYEQVEKDYGKFLIPITSEALD